MDGWFADSDGQWYYLSSDHDGSFGAMETGWLYGADAYWYYLSPSSGAMVTGWHLIDGKRYYFNLTANERTWVMDEKGDWVWNRSTAIPYGAMYADTITPDGRHVGTDGSRID